MINYPNSKKNTVQKANKDNGSKRGMTLESELDSSNKYYLAQSKANIHKKPTPIQIVKVDYPKRTAAKITEAYFKQPSTTDYNGIYRGYYIDFEAKETQNKTKFILANIHPHQIKHLKSVIDQGGIAFLIIRFSKLAETYVLNAQIVVEAIQNNEKSLNYGMITKSAFLVEDGYNPRLDYLKAVDILIDKRCNDGQ
ncbi:MAG: Holliday junction resolvase RecU [Erysipelotrichales bacterium]